MSEFFNFVRAQWHDIKGNAKWDFIKLGAIAIIATPAAIIHFIGHAPLWEVLVVLVVSTICVAVLFCVILWAIKKWGAQKSEEERNKESVDKIARRAFPDRFEPTSDLEIEGVQLDIATAQYHFCQIRIHNKSSTKTADNVRVELISLEDAAGTSPADNYFRPAFPIILKPEIAGENTINPGASQKYNLFRVSMNTKSAIIKDGVVMGWQQKFLAYFTQETTKDVTQFIWKESYRLKLAVTARDFIKAERELFLTFSDEGGFCRFNITNTRLSKAVENKQPEPFVVTPEFVGEFSGKVAHKCTKCGFIFLIQNPILMAVEGGGSPVVTCPNKRCGQVDFVGVPKDSAEEAKPLAISASYKKLSVHTHWQYAVEIEIHNENKSVSNVKLRLIKVEPPFHAQHGTSDRYDLDAIEFPLIGSSDRVLHKNQKCRVRLCIAELSGGVSLEFPPINQGKPTIFAPQIENGKPVEHVLTLETSAFGVDAQISKFRIKFQTDNQGPPARLEEIEL